MRRFLSRSASALAVVCLLLTLASCSPLPSRNSSETRINSCFASQTVEPADVTGVFVEPDDGHDPVVAELDGAHCAIDLTVYLLTDEEIVAALERAVARQVRVRVVLEEHPFGGGGGEEEMATHLREIGAEVRWSNDGFRFTHAKYMVIDRQVAVIMNLNLTRSAFSSNREFGVVTTSADEVGQAQAIFDADWANHDSTDLEGPLITSPDTSRERYMQLIASATTSIDLYAEVVRDPGIMTSLEEASGRGVRVRLIVNDPENEEDREVIDRLVPTGVEVRTSGRFYIHAKLMIVDSRLAVVGSQNFTATSLDDNREVAMVVEEELSLRRCVAIFEADWDAASRPRNAAFTIAIPTGVVTIGVAA